MNRVIPCLLVLVAAPLALLMPEPTFAALQLPMTLHPDYPRIELPFAPQPVPATLPASLVSSSHPVEVRLCGGPAGGVPA